MTKEEKIAELKIEFPTLKEFIDGNEIELSPADYEAKIESWAEIELAKIADEEAAILKAAEKQALLDRLGITADEAKLLLS